MAPQYRTTVVTGGNQTVLGDKETGEVWQVGMPHKGDPVIMREKEEYDG